MVGASPESTTLWTGYDKFMFYVYALKNKIDSELYKGYTSDLKQRFKEHGQGKNFSAKNKGQWEIIFNEAYLNENDAKRRERYLKTSQGIRLLKRMLKEYFYEKKIRN